MGFFAEGKVSNKLSLDAVYKKVQEILTDDPLKEDNPDFLKLHGKNVVMKDMAKVAVAEANFKNSSPEQIQAKQLAEIIEYIMYEQAELGQWFGEKAQTVKTTKYDDYMAGVDMVIEFDESEADAEKFSHLGLAVDVTYGNNFKNKFNNIMREISAGQLAEVKYFKSERTGEAKELHSIPRVVLNLDQKTTMLLIELWDNHDVKALTAHPVSIQVLAQTVAQLRVFAKYAQRNSSNKNVASSYTHFADLLDPVWKVWAEARPEQADRFSIEKYEVAYKEFLDL